MSERLFSTGKVPLFLDGFSPGIEKRRGDEVKIVNVTLRLDNFDAQLAASIDDGLGGDSNVKASLFSLTTSEPKPHLEKVGLALGCPRQTLTVFAAPDLPAARIAFPQVRIVDTSAKRQKDGDAYDFIIKASFGPVGRDDLEFLQHWYRNSQFVTFEEAEPGLFDGDVPEDGPIVVSVRDAVAASDEPELVEETEKAREVGAKLPAKRGRKKTAKHNPEAERASQVAAVKGKPNGAAHA